MKPVRPVEYWRLPPFPLTPGEEWWVGPRAEMSTKLSEAIARGEIDRDVTSYRIGDEWQGVLVRRISPARETSVRSTVSVRYTVTVGGVLLGLLFLAGLARLGSIASESAKFPAVVFTLILIAMALIKTACRPARQKHRCSGHCPGCGG